MTAGRVAFHPAQTEERPEELLREPALLDLAGEVRQDRVDSAAAEGLLKRHEDVRCPEIAVVLRDFVLEDEVIPEGVPRQLRDQSMILVEVVAIVRQDQ